MEVNRKVFCSLKVNGEDLAKLHSVVNAFEEACNYASEIAFRRRIHEPKVLHDRVYRELRVIFKLPAALAVRAIQKVASIYRESSYKLHIFKERSLSLDKKLFCLKRTGRLVASIATASGRIKAELEVGDYQRSLLRNPVTRARLILKGGEYPLFKYTWSVRYFPRKWTILWRWTRAQGSCLSHPTALRSMGAQSMQKGSILRL